MAGKFDKNYTENGYLMNYVRGEPLPSYKHQVFQFRVEVLDIEPLIWRRIQVPSDYNFWDLHVAIQDAMGWLDYHLHHFEIRGKHKRKEARIGIPDFDPLEGQRDVFPGWEIPVIQYFNDLGITARYIYDYGDSWMHTVKLEGYLYKEKDVDYPVCIDGERACPPEDCGGVMGYSELLETLKNPDHADYEDIKTWVGSEWEAETFDKKAVRFHNPYKRWRIAFFE